MAKKNKALYSRRINMKVSQKEDQQAQWISDIFIHYYGNHHLWKKEEEEKHIIAQIKFQITTT